MLTGDTQQAAGSISSSNELLASGSQEDPYDVDALEGSVENKEDLKNKIAIAERSYNSLFEFKSLNTFLCLRLKLYREECLINTPVVPSGTETSLQCHETDEEPSRVQKEISVSLSTTTGLNTELYFVANSTYESTPFGEGTSVIQFNSTSGTSTLAPSFRELESLIIRPSNSGATLPSYSTISLTVLIDGSPIISGGILPAANAEEEGSEYRINLKQILETSQSSLCSISGEQIAEVTETAKAYTTANKPSFTPFSNQEESLDVASKITLVESRIASSESELNVERTRYSDFLSEMQTTEYAGCRLSQDLTKISIRIYGNIEAQDVIKYNSTEPMSFSNQSTDCMNLHINLGTGLSWDVDQSTQGLLGSTAPEFIPEITGQGLTMGNMNKVYLKRSGVCIDNQQVAVSKGLFEGIFGGGNDYNYNVFEENIFSITGITITANDLIVYDNRTLDITFSREYELTWEDPLFEQNQKWIEMLQNEECNQTQ